MVDAFGAIIGDRGVKTYYEVPPSAGSFYLSGPSWVATRTGLSAGGNAANFICPDKPENNDSEDQPGAVS
jgi:hypothetical protein